MFNRYDNAPWSTSALGTSTTYDGAEVIQPVQDPRLPKFVMELIVILTEFEAEIVIA